MIFEITYTPTRQLVMLKPRNPFDTWDYGGIINAAFPGAVFVGSSDGYENCLVFFGLVRKSNMSYGVEKATQPHQD